MFVPPAGARSRAIATPYTRQGAADRTSAEAVWPLLESLLKQELKKCFQHVPNSIVVCYTPLVHRWFALVRVIAAAHTIIPWLNGARSLVD